MRSKFSSASLLSTLFLQGHARMHAREAEVNKSIYQNHKTKAKFMIKNTSREGQLHQRILEELWLR